MTQGCGKTEDKAAGHKYASPAAFAFASASSCKEDVTDQNRYYCPRYGATPDAAVGYFTYNMQWTPPLEAAGRNYKVCVVAEDNAPSAATRCFTFEVKRCMYCTASESLSHVATRWTLILCAKLSARIQLCFHVAAQPVTARAFAHTHAGSRTRALTRSTCGPGFEQAGCRSGHRMTRSG